MVTQVPTEGGDKTSSERKSGSAGP
jgi:hypothetical protein